MFLIPGSVAADQDVIMVPTNTDYILKSFDKGNSWLVDPLRNSRTTSKVVGAGGKTKLVLDHSFKGGTITTNNGGSWKETGSILNLTNPVDATSARDGEFIVAGNEIFFRKMPGIDTWSYHTFPWMETGKIKALASLRGTDDYFILTALNRVLHSPDVGMTFNQVKIFDGEAKFISSVSGTLLFTFVTGTSGKTIFRSTNRGTSWDSIPCQHDLLFLRMISIAQGIAVDGANNVFYTTDSMKTWHPAEVPPLREVQQTGGLEAIGFDLAFRVHYSTDAGKTWEKRSEPGNSDLAGVSILSQNEMFVVRKGGKIYKSGNYGYGWQQITDTIPGAVLYTTREGDSAFLVKTSTNGIFRFQQSPRAITPVNVPPLANDPLIFAYDSTYLLADNSASLWISTNRGVDWQMRALPAARQTNFIYPWGANIYVAQDSGYYLWSTDQGLTWQQKRVSVVHGDRILGITGQGNNIFLAARVSGMHYSSDGGTTWRVNGFPVARFFYCDPTHYYFQTQTGKLVSTTNFGASYIEDTGPGFSPSNVFLLAVRHRTFGLVLNHSSLMIRYAMGLPVEFTTFSAETVRNGVLLNWTTATETNNHGFFVQKNSDGSWRDLAFVPGKGSTVSVNYYSFTDENRPATGEKVLYRLRQIDHSGEMSYSKEIEVTGVPAELSLQQNYPNPFNPVTVIHYALPARGSAIAGYAELKVYNALGEVVKILTNDVMPAGEHSVEFNAADLPSGIYFYRLESGNTSLTRKMTLLK